MAGADYPGVSNPGVAVIVGGTGGVGSLVTMRLAAAGNDIVLVYRSADAKAMLLQRQIQDMGRRCTLFKADVSDPAAVARLVTAVSEEFGRIDILINTQGWLQELQLLHESSLGDLQRTIDVELMSVLYTCRAVIPLMILQRAGRIVTIGSDSGKVGSAAGAASAAARGGVIALSKGLAREVAQYGVTVNVVCPGPIETDLFQRNEGAANLTAKLSQAMVRASPMKRLARPEEVADLVSYLALGEGASFITGQAISVSGGLTMC